MELMGSTLTSAYARPRTGHFLPAITSGAGSRSLWRSSDLRRSSGATTSLALVPADNLDLVRAKTMFYPTARTVLSTRYSPDDWHRSNQNSYSQSESSRKSAERLRRDTVRLIQDRNQLTRRSQESSSRDIGQRLNNIVFWTSELKHEIDNMVTETAALAEVKRRLERALAETEGPFQVSQECLYHREKRMSIDLVHDDVERSLIKEVEVIRSCQDRMRRFLERAAAQLASNRGAQHELEKDLSDKAAAQRIDDRCHHLRNTSDGIGFYRGIERLDPSLSLPESWSRFTDDNILRSQGERAASQKLRDEMEILMNTTCGEMWNQFNSVNVAFSNRTSETADAKNSLQTHLAKTVQEIFQTEMLIESLQKAIREKEGPLKVAQTRLEERTRRPNVELCRDNPHHSLVSEVMEIEDTVYKLRERLLEAETTLQGLLKTKTTLEHQLSIKANSLFLDQEKCMSLRKSFPSFPRLVGYT